MMKLTFTLRPTEQSPCSSGPGSARGRPTFPQGQGQQLVQPGVAQLPRASTGPLQSSGHKSHSLWRVWVHQAKQFSQVF